MAAADFDAVLSLPCAALGIRVLDDAVTEVVLLPVDTPPRAATAPLAERACGEFRAYLDDPGHVVRLPLRIEGSEFQRRVWSAIARIPSGSTRTYRELANELGSTARAVGQACGDNRLPLAIPCHRVVGANGVGGFAHRTDRGMVDVKRWLLAHESRPLFMLAP